MPIPVLAIHGGAGTISRAVIDADAARGYADTLNEVLDAGYALLRDGASALEAVTVAVSMFEDSPLFNAGKGSVYTSAATHEMDASIMDGSTLACGAVACVRGVKNPVRAARAVMEQSRHVLMVGEGAEAFLRAHGVSFADEEYFHTEQRLEQLRLAREQDAFGLVLDHDGAAASGAKAAVGSAARSATAPLNEKTKMGTVGAVARDAEGRLAAATSTGGMTNKLPGRVGDTPLIGAGCYADGTAAVSCTGTGEYFIRLVVARDVTARMHYLGESLEVATGKVLEGLGRLGGSGGFIAVDKNGNVMLPFNTEGMYRGCVRRDGTRMVGIYGDDT